MCLCIVSSIFVFLAWLGTRSLMCMAQCPVVSVFRIVARYSVATVVRVVTRYSLGSRSFCVFPCGSILGSVGGFPVARYSVVIVFRHVAWYSVVSVFRAMAR